MICPFCHNEIADGSLICPFCDEQIAVRAEREKCDAIAKSWRHVLSDTLHKPLFLVGLIMMATSMLRFCSISSAVSLPLLPCSSVAFRWSLQF